MLEAGWFRPPGGWEGGGGMRVLGRLFGGRSVGTRLRAMNVLALTPTRVLVYTASTYSGSLSPRKLLAEWPAGEVSVGSQKRKATSVKYVDDRTNPHVKSDWRIVVVTLRAPGEADPLEMHFPDETWVGELTEAIRARRDRGRP